MPNADTSEEKVAQMALTELRELRKLLVGNGSVGLFEEVRDAKADIVSLREEMRRVWEVFGTLDKKDRSNVAMVEQAIRQTMPNPDAHLKMLEAKWVFWAKVVGIAIVPNGLIEVLVRIFS
jgi:hypothetical protein